MRFKSPDSQLDERIKDNLKPRVSLIGWRPNECIAKSTHFLMIYTEQPCRGIQSEIGASVRNSELLLRGASLSVDQAQEAHESGLGHCVKQSTYLSAIVKLTYGSLRQSESASWYLPHVSFFLCDVMESYEINGIFYKLFVHITLPRPRQCPYSL